MKQHKKSHTPYNTEHLHSLCILFSNSSTVAVKFSKLLIFVELRFVILFKKYILEFPKNPYTIGVYYIHY